MPFKFASQPLQSGLYEPEGIYLHPPFEGRGVVLCPFGADAAYFGQYTYNGVPLKGHNGIDFGVSPSSQLLAVDDGRIVEIGDDPGGFKRYIKVEHRWGEAIYAFTADASVDSGQIVLRGEPVGRAASLRWQDSDLALLHFGVRVTPYNRFDGWGGFANPLLFLSATDLVAPEVEEFPAPTAPPHALKAETAKMRRP